MSEDDLRRQLEDAREAVLILQDELTQTNAGMVALTLELEQRTAGLEAANRELEAFSYSVSHDLRAPLRALDGFSQVLLERCDAALDEQGRHYLQRVRAAAQQMSELVDDLLDLSRVTRSELRTETVSLSALADPVVAELRRGQPERSVEVVLEPNLTTQGDRRLLRIVLDNLLGNAWKFTAGRSDARVELGALAVGGACAPAGAARSAPPGRVFFVRDNGAGFDMAYAGKLFAPFQRLHSADDYPGTGIGLAIVQRIVRRHGGSLWVEAAVNRGATFFFTLGEHRGGAGT